MMVQEACFISLPLIRIHFHFRELDYVNYSYLCSSALVIIYSQNSLAFFIIKGRR